MTMIDVRCNGSINIHFAAEPIRYQVVHNVLLVVLYKLALHESPALQSIINYFKFLDDKAVASYRLVIRDNSPESSEKDVCSIQNQLPQLSIEYVHTPENISLSKIYNKVASFLNEDEYLTLFDQDTEIPSGYFDELRVAQLKKEPLILPLVICQGKLVSPGTRFFARGMLSKDIPSGKVRSKNLLAINSGMSIQGRVLRLIKYDERLRFYGTDTYFMKNYEKYFDHAFALNTQLLHSLAEMEEKSEDWYAAYAAERFRTFHIIFTDSVLEIVFVKLYEFIVKTKSCLMAL